MKIVICAADGEHFFSGSSLFTSDDPVVEVLGEESCELEEELLAPPLSGVFPTKIWEDDELDGELDGAMNTCATASGIFPRNSALDEATMDESLEDIDATFCELARECA